MSMVELLTLRIAMVASYSSLSGIRSLGGHTLRFRLSRQRDTSRLEIGGARNGPKRPTNTYGVTLGTRNTSNGMDTRIVEARLLLSRRAANGRDVLMP